MQCACLAAQVEQAASPETVERLARLNLPCSTEQSSYFLSPFSFATPQGGIGGSQQSTTGLAYRWSPPDCLA